MGLSAGTFIACLTLTLQTTLAQTTGTTCNPLSASNCSPDPALSTPTYAVDWSNSDSLSGWTTTSGSIGFGDNGAEFVINKEGDAPTIQSDFYIFFGKVEVEMQAAPGTGIVSSIVLLSDVNDEIDWVRKAMSYS
jgi:hypothetical protein